MKKLLLALAAMMLLVGCSAKPAEFDKVGVFKEALTNHQSHQKMDVSVDVDAFLNIMGRTEPFKMNATYKGNKNIVDGNDLNFIATMSVGKIASLYSMNMYGKDATIYLDGTDTEPIKYPIDETMSTEDYQALTQFLNLTDFNNFKLADDALEGMIAKKTKDGYLYTIASIEHEASRAIEKVMNDYAESMGLRVHEIAFDLLISNEKELQSLDATIAFTTLDDDLEAVTLKTKVNYNGFDDAVNIVFPDLTQHIEITE